MPIINQNMNDLSDATTLGNFNRYQSIKIYRQLTPLAALAPITIQFEIKPSVADIEIQIYPYQSRGISYRNVKNIKVESPAQLISSGDVSFILKLPNVNTWSRVVFHANRYDWGTEGVLGDSLGAIAWYNGKTTSGCMIRNFKIEQGHTEGYYTPRHNVFEGTTTDYVLNANQIELSKYGSFEVI